MDDLANHREEAIGQLQDTERAEVFDSMRVGEYYGVTCAAHGDFECVDQLVRVTRAEFVLILNPRRFARLQRRR